MSVAPLISVGSGRLTQGIKSLYIPAHKCFPFFFFSPPYFSFCVLHRIGDDEWKWQRAPQSWWREDQTSDELVPSDTTAVQPGAWFALNTASVGSAKQLSAYSTSVNPRPSVCSWTAASRHFPPEKTLPRNTCEPQCQIPWQVLMDFTKALRILISRV